MTTTTWIQIPFQFYARHRYEAAPEQVKFLRSEHPHDFECWVDIQVFSDDRELEYYIVREFLNNKVPRIKKRLLAENNKMSCEMICDLIYEFLFKEYCLSVNRDIKVKVTEDGKYGAIKHYQVEGR